jgi:hypothetical protein
LSFSSLRFLETLCCLDAEFFDFGFKIIKKMSLVLEKSKSIQNLLTKLFQRFGEPNFYLTDFWDADLRAIGIKNSKDGEFLIYVSTWKIKKNHYFVEVEDSKKEVVLNGYNGRELYERSFEELSELVTKYLNLQPIYEQ